MATVHFRNAVILAGGFDLSGDHNGITVDLKAEMLDETAFGDSTRIHKGGLTVADISGKGNWDAAAGHVDRILFDLVGVDDTVVTVFPNGITEGTLTLMGFSVKGVVEHYNVGGDVGTLLPFDLAIMGRGIEA